VVAFFSTLGTLITTILAAFAFARLEFKGRDAVFLVFLMTMMIPGEMMVISNYITVASFGWIGFWQTLTPSLLAMIVPFMVSVFYIYLTCARTSSRSPMSFIWRPKSMARAIGPSFGK
jgi:multiple sugar transport system permease protein